MAWISFYLDSKPRIKPERLICRNLNLKGQVICDEYHSLIIQLTTLLHGNHMMTEDTKTQSSFGIKGEK